MTDNIKRMDIAEFVELGFLQEVNRQFFHPLGLALEVQLDESGTPVRFGGVWDYRDDPEGIVFDGEVDPEKAARVERLQIEAAARRHKLFGFCVQPWRQPLRPKDQPG